MIAKLLTGLIALIIACATAYFNGYNASERKHKESRILAENKAYRTSIAFQKNVDRLSYVLENQKVRQNGANQVIRERIITHVKDNPVYRTDCVDVGGVSLLNEARAIANGSAPDTASADNGDSEAAPSDPDEQ